MKTALGLLAVLVMALAAARGAESPAPEPSDYTGLTPGTARVIMGDGSIPGEQGSPADPAKPQIPTKRSAKDVGLSNKVTTTRFRVAGEANPGAGSEQGGWVEQERYESVHFTIVADVKDDEYFSRLQGDLERYFSRMQKEFWDFIPPEHRESHITVMVFATQGAFDAYAQRDSGMPRGEKGYSSSKADRIVFARQDAYYRDIMILVHELTHAFNRYCVGQSPIWLDEGMAQYYSYYAGFEAGNANLKDGVNPEALANIDEALKAGAFAEISDLMSMGDDAFYGGATDLNYAESWALVQYMRRGRPDGDDSFTVFYSDLVRGVSSYDAFLKAYGSSQDLFRSGWISYLGQLYNYTVRDRLKLKGEPSAKGTGQRDVERKAK